MTDEKLAEALTTLALSMGESKLKIANLEDRTSALAAKLRDVVEALVLADEALAERLAAVELVLRTIRVGGSADDTIQAVADYLVTPSSTQLQAESRWIGDPPKPTRWQRFKSWWVIDAGPRMGDNS